MNLEIFGIDWKKSGMASRIASVLRSKFGTLFGRRLNEDAYEGPAEAGPGRGTKSAWRPRVGPLGCGQSGTYYFSKAEST